MKTNIETTSLDEIVSAARSVEMAKSNLTKADEDLTQAEAAVDKKRTVRDFYENAFRDASERLRRLAKTL